MNKFIMACECPMCGKVCKVEENVVSLNNFSCESWHCDDCDIDFGTCEVENIIEAF
mgnify:CR=1 FL=1